MKSIEKQVSDYIQKCVSSGILSMVDIHKNLEKEMSDIRVKLAETEPLRIELLNLQRIHDKFEDILSSDKMQSTFDDDSEEMQTIRSTIITIVGKSQNLSNRDIINKFMEINKDAYGSDAKIIRAVKWLFELGILDRDANRNIVPGPKWEN